MKYNVKNTPSYLRESDYTVIRECYDGYWYHSGWNDLYRASLVCNELGNGRIVKSTDINRI